MTDALRIALAALATYRLAQLFTIDDGPHDIFFRLRAWAGVYVYGEDGRPATNWGRLWACPYCVGMYAALFLAPFIMWPTRPGDYLLVVLGLAGAQTWLQGARDASS